MRISTVPPSSAWLALVALRSVLLKYAVGFCRDRITAEDLVQETLILAATNWDKFAPDTNLAAWCGTIMRNFVYRQWRKRRREVEDIDGMYAAGLRASDDQHSVLEVRIAMQHLSCMPPPCATCFRS